MKPNIGSMAIFRSSSVLSVGYDEVDSTIVPLATVDDADQIVADLGNFASLFEKAAAFFNRHELKTIAISAFGPFGSLRLGNKGYGLISNVMTDAGAGGTNIAALARRYFGEGPDIRIVTDANAIALGESCRRASLREFPFQDNGEVDHEWFDASTVVALLLGTGIGGGIAMGSRIYNGRLHPEMGHMVLGRFEGDNRQTEACAHHSDCVTALAARASLEDVDGNISAQNWDYFGGYAARLCIAVTHILAPSAIVLAGSTIFKNPSIVDDIRGRVNVLLASKAKKTDEGPNRMLRYPELDQTKDFISLAQSESHSYGTLLAATQAASQNFTTKQKT